MTRRAFDFYPTPTWATGVLVREVPELTTATVLECCAGRDDITSRLRASGATVLAKDINAPSALDWSQNALDPETWKAMPPCEWVVTNPPFNDALEILKHAYAHASRGVAFLLRLSFIEPTEDRGLWLAKHPVTQLIVMPRISFTGDGKCDNVTTAWFVWRKGSRESRVTVVPKQLTMHHPHTLGERSLFDQEVAGS